MKFFANDVLVVVGRFRFWTILAFSFAGLVPVAAQQVAGKWQIVPFFKTDTLSCYLRYQNEVGPLDENWMEVVFVNRTNQPQSMGSWQLNVFATVEDIPDTIISDWGKVDLIENNAWLMAGVTSSTSCFRYGVCIPPNDSVISRFLAEYTTSAMLCAEIDPQGPQVKPFDRTYRGHVRMYYTESILPYGVHQSPEIPVTWHWKAVRDKDLSGLVRRLDKTLGRLEFSASSKLLKTLLTDPRITDAFPLERYNQAIMGLENPFCRQTLLGFLNRKYPDNEVFLEYIINGIERNDLVVMQTIKEGYWHDSLVEPLANLAETSNDVYSILQLLRQYKKDFCDDRDLTARFARIVFLKFSGLGWLDSPEPNTVIVWQSAAQVLAMTCDSSAIPYFENALSLKTRYTTYGPYDFSNTPAFLPPMRVCDFALESIMKIRGYDPEKLYLKAAGLEEVKNQPFVRDFYHPQSLNNRANIESIRDTLIALYPHLD